MMIRDVKSIVLVSPAPDIAAQFYRDLFELPLEREQHDSIGPHWACRLGSVHLAIHSRDAFLWPTAGGDSTTVSFNIDALEPFTSRAERMGIDVFARWNIGAMQFAAVRDPDGRAVCCGTAWRG